MFFLSSSARAAPKISPSTGYLSGKFHNLQQEVISGSNLPTSVYPLTKKWTYQVNFIQDSNNNVTAYVVDKANHSETDDASGHVWECQDTTYDEGAAAGVATPAAGWPTTQKSDTTCGNSATALTSYTAYDQYGNIARRRLIHWAQLILVYTAIMVVVLAGQCMFQLRGRLVITLVVLPMILTLLHHYQ